MEQFKAVEVDRIDGNTVARLCSKTLADLPEGDVVIDVEYSSDPRGHAVGDDRRQGTHA